MTKFDTAFKYVILNEGEQSNHPADRGGLTRWGITDGVAASHRCMIHPNGVDVKKVNLEVAKHIYLEDYWEFEGIENLNVCVKLFDMGVNFGVKTACLLAQETVNVMTTASITVDGILGKVSCANINALNAQRFLDQLEYLADDRYMDIIVNDFIKAYGKPALHKRQLAFGKGWFRRSNKRFYVEE